MFLGQNQTFSETSWQKHCIIFPMSECERMPFAKRQLQTTKWKTTKRNCTTTGEFHARFDHLQELKPCFAFLVNQYNDNVVCDGYPVRQPFVTNLSAVQKKLSEIQDDWV